jgi:hypothetical protein
MIYNLVYILIAERIIKNNENLTILMDNNPTFPACLLSTIIIPFGEEFQ